MAKDPAKCDVDPVCMMDLKEMHGKFAYEFEDETLLLLFRTLQGPVCQGTEKVHQETEVGAWRGPPCAGLL